MGYAKDGISGISWLGLFRIITRFVTFARIAILARILTPAQFGVFGIASIVLSFLEVMTNTGITVFLIQEKYHIDHYLNTAWVLSIIRGFAIGILIFLSASPVAIMLDSPDSRLIILAISLVPLIKGFINPSLISFQKNLQFKKEAWFRIIIFMIGTLVTILAAFLTKLTISLVIGLLVEALVEVFLSFVLIRPRPKFLLNLSKAKKILKRGTWMTSASIFNYLFHQGDDMVVAKLLGTSALGHYQMAYKISTLPITEVADIFGRVSFPIYAKISEDTKRLRQAFIKTSLTIAALIIPFGVILFSFAEPLVKIILGDGWLVIVPVLRILTIFGVVRAISGSSSALLLALHKQSYVSVVTLVSMLGMGVSVLPLSYKYGLIGTGWAVLIGAIVALPSIIYYVHKVLR